MKYVTSFGPDGYELYGRKFLETYVQHMTHPITVYVESPASFEHELITYKNLFDVPGCLDFLSKCDDFPAFHGHLWGEKRNYRFDVSTFCRKSFAQCDAAADSDGWLVWVDADVELSGPLPDPKPWGFIHFLGRPDWHSCASYVAWNLDHPISAEFWKRYWMLYVTGTVFVLPEWHDSYILDFLRINMKLPSVDLAVNFKNELKGPANVFDVVFPMGHHKKGNLKHEVNYRNRYEELMDIVNKAKPKRILEVGTWNGNRALELCKGGAEYVGFDLFETATNETDQVEKNVKAHYSVKEVSAKLNGIKHELVKGNTRDTLPAYSGEKFDFAFIDGGHSVETIQSDWDNVRRLMKPGGIVVFDDYYEGMPESDLDKWGANRVLESVDHKLGVMADPVKGGGYTKLAIVKCP